MIDSSQATPFVGVVNSDRQKTKAPRGTTVEVRLVKEGKFGVFALCFLEGSDKPMFLKPRNIDFVESVSDERRVAIEDEKKAWAAEKNEPVAIGTGEVQTSGKSVLVYVNVSIAGQGYGSGRPIPGEA